jgi:hypothetical protein
MPGFVTAAMLVLWAPGLFRLTCYYYRGAYYKAFWADPLNCTVGEPRKTYWGERYFPLIIQNVHRYFLYLALLFLVFLAHDVWKALWFDGKFGIGVGTLARKKMYDCVSCMNRHHMLFAWMSLFWVAFSDLYVRMCSMGIWTDWRII